MALLTPADRNFLDALTELSYCNQFLPERVELERQALGANFDETEAVWSLQQDLDGDRANVNQINARIEPLAEQIRGQLSEGADADLRELALYEDLVQYLLYYRYRDAFSGLIEASGNGRVRFWDEFLGQFNFYLSIPGRKLPSQHDPAHMFAVLFQVRRAFDHIFQFIVGRSMPAAKLRAAVWQSIFTHDMRRYRRALFDKMGDFTTLIAGPSGTGKELVAQAIGLSRFIPFNSKLEQFEENSMDSFHPLNLSALSPTLIESELFGHCKGAFTGAHSDRQGWLETCTPLGTVFLDEIGELDPAIQVKLLRVLQTRTFQRLGETSDRYFSGKIIAATNRDLAAEMHAGRFRQDFYYRLCSDTIQTPSLREQLANSPDDLKHLVQFIATRLLGDEGAEIASDVLNWIKENLQPDYPWPGNIRELEQCVRNVMIHNQYVPSTMHEANRSNDPCQRLVADITDASISAEEILRRYCTMAYAKLGSYEQTAKRLGLDRRTVKARIDDELLAQLKNPS